VILYVSVALGCRRHVGGGDRFRLPGADNFLHPYMPILEAAAAGRDRGVPGLRLLRAEGQAARLKRLRNCPPVSDPLDSGCSMNPLELNLGPQPIARLMRNCP
jgi:hypothetical protein